MWPHAVRNRISWQSYVRVQVWICIVFTAAKCLSRQKIYLRLPLYFSQGYSLDFFSFLLIYGGLGVGVLGIGSWIGFLGLVFSVDGFLACGVEPSGSLYTKIEE